MVEAQNMMKTCRFSFNSPSKDVPDEYWLVAKMIPAMNTKHAMLHNTNVSMEKQWSMELIYGAHYIVHDCKEWLTL